MPLYKKIKQIYSGPRFTSSLRQVIAGDINPSCEGLTEDFTQRIDQMDHNFKKNSSRDHLWETA